MVNEKYKLLNESLKALRNGTIKLLCLSGSAGFGKSYDTIKYLNETNCNYSYINCYSSPLAFYHLLFKNKDKEVIIFDDVQSLDNNIIISLLKSACWGVIKDKRIISWNTTSDTLNKLDIPEEFELNANIILIFNDINTDFKPIINRSVNIEFNFNFKEKIDIFRGLNLDEEIIKYIETNCNESTENLSIRTIVILTNLKKGSFDWRSFAKEILKNNEENELLLSLVSKSHKLRDACSEWVKRTGKSRASFFRYYKELNH